MYRKIVSSNFIYNVLQKGCFSKLLDTCPAKVVKKIYEYVLGTFKLFLILNSKTWEQNKLKHFVFVHIRFFSIVLEPNIFYQYKSENSKWNSENIMIFVKFWTSNKNINHIKSYSNKNKLLWTIC